MRVFFINFLSEGDFCEMSLGTIVKHISKVYRIERGYWFELDYSNPNKAYSRFIGTQK